MRLGRAHSRVRGAPEVLGEFPTACLAEEIETPGDGQIRALITVAGNPALSAPNGDRLAAAFASLEAMICVDAYLNETTRHAHVILPPPSPLERSHYDLAFYQLSTRNIAHYSLPVFARAPSQPDEWEILLRLMGAVAGRYRETPVAALDDVVARGWSKRRRARRARRWPGATWMSCWRRWLPGADPSACSTSCCASDRMAMASARGPMG